MAVPAVRPAGSNKGAPLLLSAAAHLAVALVLLLAWRHRPPEVLEPPAMVVSIRLEAPGALSPAAAPAPSPAPPTPQVRAEASAPAVPEPAKPSQQPARMVRVRHPIPPASAKRPLSPAPAAVSPVPATTAGDMGSAVQAAGDGAGAGAVSAGTGISRSAAADGGGEADASAMRDWLAQVRQRIQDHLVFPSRARKLGLGGRSRVHLRVLADGSLDETALAVVGGTGFDVLDQGAVASVRAAAPFPPPPFGPVEAEVPVAFTVVHP